MKLIYLKQSDCLAQAETLFGVGKVKLGHTPDRLEAIYLKSATGNSWSLLGKGIGWHLALEDARKNAAEIVAKYGDKADPTLSALQQLPVTKELEIRAIMDDKNSDKLAAGTELATSGNTLPPSTLIDKE